MKTEFTESELRAAYDMCRLVKHNSDNVTETLKGN